MTAVPRNSGRVLGAEIDALTLDAASSRVLAWAQAHESRYVVLANAHVVVTATHEAGFGVVVNAADMATPDGAPVAWVMRHHGHLGQPRVSGPDLMWALLGRCAAEGAGVYCYGSTSQTLELLRQKIVAAFPAIRLAGMESPPFRPLSAEEDAAAVARINQSGAGVVFVGLGCPKQEFWMAEHRGRINAVMLGVGAAFDFHAGTVSRAPAWMRNHGLEWLHRLISEPRRLWKRYLVTNTLFVLGAARQWVGARGVRR